MEPIQHLVSEWLALDQDEITRKDIQDLVDAHDTAELELRLRKRISFGTAGLRSSMKAGFAHMNSVTVIQASQGLAQYILDQKLTAKSAGSSLHSCDVLRTLKVVVGFDARYNSEKYARLAAAAFLAKGFKVLWFGQIVHTPMVPFTVLSHGAVAGVMITASHNPKNDNGYKVYWSNGRQIIPPHDSGIASAIDQERELLTWDTLLVDKSSGVQHIFSETTEAYQHSIATLCPIFDDRTECMKFMYTPMHGVGLWPMNRMVKRLHLDQYMHVVESQANPHPDFPTVPFPNPEEKGALELAKAKASEEGCSIVLANDPDADRFAAAERLPYGSWHQFTGNQMGILLASFVFEMYAGDKKKLAMLASTVSSRMLAAMAAREDFRFQETLTGFKWLGNVGQEMQARGYEVVYAYEEAIGYMFPNVVWDKDGITAAAMFLCACILWKKQNLTPWQKLQQLYERYGYFEDANTYLISPSPATTNKVFNNIRSLKDGSRPEVVGNEKILRWRDLTVGYDSGTENNMPDLPIDKSSQMITCELEDTVFTVRGSGTEPKIKIYIEARGASAEGAKRRAEAVLGDLLREWFRPEYGLTLAGA